MALLPDHVLTTVLNDVYARLRGINGKDPYTVDVGGRVYEFDNLNDEVEVPSLCVVSRASVPNPQGHSSGQMHQQQRINVAGIMGYEGAHPEAHIRPLMADVEVALGTDHRLDAFYKTGIPVGSQAGNEPGTYQVVWAGSIVNGGPPIDGRVYFQTDFLLLVAYAWANPRFII